MALMTAQSITNVITPSFAAAATTDTITYQPGLILYVKVGGTATTVTLVIPGNDDYTNLAKQDLPQTSISNTERAFYIPRLAADSTGVVTVTYSQVTAVTSALIKIPT